MSTTRQLGIRSPAPLQPSWLTELTLFCPPDKVTVLVHVKSCRAASDGGFIVTAQPFGLAGDEDVVWRRLIEHTQPTQQIALRR